MTLSKLTPHGVQRGSLTNRFDALGDDGEAECATKLDDAPSQ